MGFFSWKTVEGNKSISNRYSVRKALPVALLIPKEFGGGVIIEKNYEGYGEFGGKDAYALLAQWNKPEECISVDDRDRGIGVNLEENEKKYPLKFVELNYYKKTKCKYEDFDEASKNCEYQGFFYWDDEEYKRQEELEELKEFLSEICPDVDWRMQ